MSTKANREGGQGTTPEPGEERPPAPPAPPMKHYGQLQGYDMSHTGAKATLIGNAELAELRRKAALYDANEQSLRQYPRMHAALLRIQTWFGMFPETGQFWDKEGKDPMSYAACYGTNGERDYMRKVARDALESPLPDHA